MAFNFKVTDHFTKFGEKSVTTNGYYHCMPPCSFALPLMFFFFYMLSVMMKIGFCIMFIFCQASVCVAASFSVPKPNSTISSVGHFRLPSLSLLENCDNSFPAYVIFVVI